MAHCQLLVYVICSRQVGQMSLCCFIPYYGMPTFYSTLQKLALLCTLMNSDVLCYCLGNASVKKCVLSRDLNCLMSLAFVMYFGKSF